MQEVKSLQVSWITSANLCIKDYRDTQSRKYWTVRLGVYMILVGLYRMRESYDQNTMTPHDMVNGKAAMHPLIY